MMFYKETEFKEESLLGEIPRDWNFVKLEEITTKIKDIDHKMPEKQKEGIPFVSIRCILKYPDLDFNLDINDPDLEFIDEKDYEYHVQRFNVEKGDIIYSRFGSIGNAKLVTTETPFIASYSIVLIKPDKGKVIPAFLTCVLNFERVRRQAKIATKGATNRNLHLEDIQNLRVPLPSLSEQRAVVGVLGVVDSAVELVDRVIAKTERLKKGLMQTLLTRGIGHKEYKQTTIGKIPKTWDITTTSDVTLFIKDGTHTPPKRVEKGIPLFSAQNIVGGKIVRTDEDTYITEDDYWKIHSKYEIQKNDVLLTIVGTIGNSAVVDVDYRFSLQRSVAIFRPNIKKVEPRFLHYAFQSYSFKRQLLGHSKLTTQAGVYLKELSSLVIPLPPLDEQREIASILSLIDEKLDLDRNEKAKLERIKRSLMDLLLTGKIRVKVD